MRRSHELFFTLSPDKNAIESNISRALLLADKSAYNYYRDFSEKGYYNRIIAGNINQVVQRSMQLRPLSVFRKDVCPTADYSCQQRHGTQPRYGVPAAEHEPKRRQSERFQHRGI